MNKSIRIASSLALLALLAACGAKGPLVLPEKAQEAAQAEVDSGGPITAPVQTDVEQTQADQQAEEAVDQPVQPTGND